MLKFPVALLALLVVGSVAAAGEPRFTVVNKTGKRFVVINRMPATACPCTDCTCAAGVCPACPAKPVREYWGGQWGWMERGADGVYRQVTTTRPTGSPVVVTNCGPTG